LRTPRLWLTRLHPLLQLLHPLLRVLPDHRANLGALSLTLFTGVRGRRILRSSFAGSCIDRLPRHTESPPGADTRRDNDLHVVVPDKDAGRRIGPYRIAAEPGFLCRQAVPLRCVLHKTPCETGDAAPRKVPRPSAKAFALTPSTLYVFARWNALVAEGQVVTEQEIPDSA
jgi:hypothetical protein